MCSPEQVCPPLSMMKFLPVFLACLLPMALGAPSLDLDPEDNDSLEEFEEHFNLPEITDPQEKAKREQALKENEELVKDENKEFLEGKKTWQSALNEFSDLTKDEFEKEKTGDLKPEQFGRGLIDAPGFTMLTILQLCLNTLLYRIRESGRGV